MHATIFFVVEMGPVFAMLVVDENSEVVSIEFGRDFISRAQQFVRRQKHPTEAPGGKPRAQDASQWRLESWVGPFSNEDQAGYFCDLWRATTSPTDGGERRLRLVQLAIQFGRTVWTFRPKLYTGIY